MTVAYPLLTTILAEQPDPLLFATISGAHLYGFPSPDSDYDLRSVHVLPTRTALGLIEYEETFQLSTLRDGTEIDFVSHDARKFFQLLLKPNGYVLEQVYSPLVVYTMPEYEELKAIARGCITPFHAHHYLGFSRNQWDMFIKEQPHRVKPLLYVYRVLLTGIHLVRTGDIEANLVRLNDVFQLPYLPELIERKISGAEHSILDDADLGFHEGEFQRLTTMLEGARDSSSLPREPRAKAALNDLLVRLRLATLPA